MDESAYVAFCESMMPGMYRMAYSILRSRHDAEDAVQQALLNAWKYRDRARAGAERAWMMRILINVSRDLNRKRRRNLPADSFPDMAAPPTDGDTGLYEAIDELPDILRTVFLLKYMEGMTEKEISAVLHVPQTSVKNRLFRARRALQDKLKEEVAL